MAFGRKKESPVAESEAAWADYVARPEAWSSRDVSAVGQVPGLDPGGLEALKGSLAETVERVLATAEPLAALREAIMDATDRFVLAERLEGADVLEAVLEAGALRRWSKLKFKDVEKDDWYSHYLQVAEMNSRNVAEMIRKTVTGEQASLEESLHEPLTRTMHQVREALLRYPSRTPVKRADDLVSSRDSMRLAPNRDQIDRLTHVMSRRFEKLFSGQIYRMRSGSALNPSGTFRVDAGLFYTLLSLHFRRPTDAWREIMSEGLGPYSAAMQGEAALLQLGRELHLAWTQSPADGPLHRVLVRAYGIAFEAEPAAGVDAETFASEVSEDAVVLVGDVLKIIEER